MPCLNDRVNSGGEIRPRTTKPHATSYLHGFQSLLSSHSAVIKQLKNVPPATVLATLRHFFRLEFGPEVSKAKEHITHSENGKW